MTLEQLFGTVQVDNHVGVLQINRITSKIYWYELMKCILQFVFSIAVILFILYLLGGHAAGGAYYLIIFLPFITGLFYSFSSVYKFANSNGKTIMVDSHSASITIDNDEVEKIGSLKKVKKAKSKFFSFYTPYQLTIVSDDKTELVVHQSTNKKEMMRLEHTVRAFLSPLTIG